MEAESLKKGQRRKYHNAAVEVVVVIMMEAEAAEETTWSRAQTTIPRNDRCIFRSLSFSISLAFSIPFSLYLFYLFLHLDAPGNTFVPSFSFSDGDFTNCSARLRKSSKICVWRT